MKELKKIRKDVESRLDSKRYEHTLGVEYTAAALAMRYDVDLEKARFAGLLHDVAKCIPDEKKITFCKKNGIEITEYELQTPSLLHAKMGAFIAKEEFQIEDEDILNAILNHTTGRPGMSILEKIVFIADYIEPGRKTAPNLSKARHLAFKDLDKALRMILEDTLEYLKSKDEVIDPMTQTTYDYYKTEVDNE